MDKWTEFAMRIQSIAQAGVAYGAGENWVTKFD